MAKMSKTEISAKILISTRLGWDLSIKPNMKQIHGAVQALESDIEFLAAILDTVEKAEKRKKKLQGKFPRANMHTGNI